MNRFLDSALRAPLEMTEWTALRDKAFRLPQGGHIHPRRVQGEGPVGSKLSRSDDADDDGRGRSEAQPNGAPPVAALKPKAALRRIVTEIHEKAAAPVAFWLGTAAALI